MRFVAPGGVTLSGTWPMPPPRERLPQRMFLSGVTPFTSRNVLPQLPVAAVERKSKKWGSPWGAVVVVVEDVVATVVVDVDDDVVELELAVVEVLVVVVGTVVVVWIVVGTGCVVLLDVVVVDGSVDEDGVVVSCRVVVVVVGTGSVDELVVVGSMQVHCEEQVEPGGQVKAPPGELGSQGSPWSTWPLPHSAGWLVDELDDVLVLVELLVVGATVDVVVVVPGGALVDVVLVVATVVVDVDVEVLEVDVGGVQTSLVRKTRSDLMVRA